ncbi:hypothetical protein FRX31_005602 [Thalictrum thalictroides]|uniref:Uncharacterized protein n=1 Tax=Thalictrum thalictroides TaxID=46969 RepID=A0A7J6X8B6_THATH|nr:hypothetical protein FRX31_005602 [Thalictrum thalictroides]
MHISECRTNHSLANGYASKPMVTRTVVCALFHRGSANGNRRLNKVAHNSLAHLQESISMTD